MGSSAAAVVAGVLGAWALCPDVDGVDDDAVLRLTAELEGHPDNVAPACSAARPCPGRRRRRPGRVRLDVAPGDPPVVLVPDGDAVHARRPRAAARRRCRTPTPPSTPAASALLVHALTRDPALLLEATEDRLHQRQRARGDARVAGAGRPAAGRGHAAVVSGAGPERPGPRRPAEPATARSAGAHPCGVDGAAAGGRRRRGARCWSGRLRYRLGNEEHAGADRCCPVRELRLGSRRSRPLGRASRGAEADDLSSPLIRLALFRPVPFVRPRLRAGPYGDRGTPCAGTRRSPQGRTCT